MKTKYILAIILILFAQTSQAQIFKKYQKRLEDKIEKKADDILKQAENKVDNKVDKTIDGVINKTEDKVTGNDKKKSTSGSSTNGNNDELTIDDVVQMNGNPYEDAATNKPNTTGAEIFKTDGDARDAYGFTYTVKVKTKSKDAKYKKNVERTYNINMGVSPVVLGISDMVEKGSPPQSYQLNNRIYDIERKALFSFITRDKKKSIVNVAFDAQEIADVEMNTSSYARVISVQKTGETKTIAGQLAEAYLCKTAKSEAVLWISKADGVNPYPAFYNILNSTSTGDKNGAIEFYNHKDLNARLKAGAMVMAYQFTKHPYDDLAEMEVLSMGSKQITFDTRPYQPLTKY